MPLWTPKATLELVTLIRKDNLDRPKTMDDLVKEFHHCQPYNGVCQGCCVNPWTSERVVRKVRRLITEADALAEKNGTPKGSLVEPPKAEKKKSSNKSTNTASKEKAAPSTLEEMLKMALPAKETAKKTTKKQPERRSTKKTLEGVAHSSAVKAGKKPERRKRA